MAMGSGVAAGDVDVPRWGDACSRRYGIFWVTEDTPSGALLVSAEDGAVYRAMGLADTLAAPLLAKGQRLPLKVGRRNLKPVSKAPGFSELKKRNYK